MLQPASDRANFRSRTNPKPIRPLERPIDFTEGNEEHKAVSPMEVIPGNAELQLGTFCKPFSREETKRAAPYYRSPVFLILLSGLFQSNGS